MLPYAQVERTTLTLKENVRIDAISEQLQSKANQGVRAYRLLKRRTLFENDGTSQCKMYKQQDI